MTVSVQERNAPSKEQMGELLILLAEALDAGQLVGLAFMLKDGDKAAIDYRGSHDHASMMCRTVNERIAADVEQVNPVIAKAIREDLAKAH